jgi:hypothetical protein
MYGLVNRAHEVTHDMAALVLALKNRAPRISAIGRFFVTLFTGISEGQEIARRYEELSRMSDAALAGSPAKSCRRRSSPAASAADATRAKRGPVFP